MSDNPHFFSRTERVVFLDTNGSTQALKFNAEAPQVCSQDYLMAIAEGDISGHTLFQKFGRVTSVGTVAVDVVDFIRALTGAYVFPESTGQIMFLVSSSVQDESTGSGVRAVTVEYLDSTNITQFVTISMAGAQSSTVVARDMRRVNRMWAQNIAIGLNTAGNAVGDINLMNNATSRTYARISSGNTQSRQLIYTVPSGKTLYITDVNVSGGAGGVTKNDSFMIFTTRACVNPSSGTVSTNGYFYPFNEIGVYNTPYHLDLKLPTKIPQTADLKITVQGDYGNSATATAAIRGWIE